MEKVKVEVKGTVEERGLRLPEKEARVKNIDALFSLVKRAGNLAMYSRDDGYYEIFYVKYQKASISIIAGKEIHRENKELFPTEEDFGTLAFTAKSLEYALRIFDREKKRHPEWVAVEDGEKEALTEQPQLFQ